MAACEIGPERIAKVIEFHGHSCPGLAIGIRAAELALREVGHASDEEVVAVVETDMCGVDAIQVLTGCTIGKGNLRHLDHGKMAFSFYRRSDGKAIRAVLRPEGAGGPNEETAALRRKKLAAGLTEAEEERLREATAASAKRIMEASLEDLFEVRPAPRPAPREAPRLASLACEACGERTMESRTRRLGGKMLCIPCFEARESGFGPG